MHRTEGTNHSSNRFENGPPGTVLEENWLNAVQEELAYVIEEAGLTLKTATTETQTQLKEALDLLYLNAASLAAKQPGFLERSKINYSTTVDITLAAAVYHHQGTVEQLVYWDSLLTFTLGSGGSNGDSADLGNDEWHYIYIDDSALSGALITNARLLNSTTAPTWSESKHGWYNGNDRCIFAVRTNGSAQVEEFWHDGGEQVQYEAADAIESGADITTTFADASVFIMPAFSTKALIRFEGSNVSGSTNWLEIRPNGSSAATGRSVLRTGATETPNHSTIEIMTGTDQKIEWQDNIEGADTWSISIEGWYFPNGM